LAFSSCCRNRSNLAEVQFRVDCQTLFNSQFWQLPILAIYFFALPAAAFFAAFNGAFIQGLCSRCCFALALRSRYPALAPRSPLTSSPYRQPLSSPPSMGLLFKGSAAVAASPSHFARAIRRSLRAHPLLLRLTGSRFLRRLQWGFY
jgi:hypothetical protein